MSCNNLPEPSKEQTTNAAAQIATALGATACATSSDIQQFSIAGSGYVNTPIADAGVNFKQSYSDSLINTIGCEQLAIASTEFAASAKKISCFITKDTNNVNVSTKTVNTIVIEAGRDFISEAEIKLTQKAQVKVIQLTRLDQSTKNTMLNEVKTQTKNILDQIQDSKSGISATPQGSKAVSQARTNVEQVDFNQVVNDTVRDISINTDTQNIIKIKAGRDIIFKAKFEANQELLADVTAQVFLSTAVSAALESFTENLSETQTQIKQKAENLGADTLGTQAGDGIAKMTKAARESQFGATSIVFVIAAAIVAVIFLKKGGGGGGTIVVAGTGGSGGTTNVSGKSGGFGKVAIVLIGLIIGSLGIYASYKAMQSFTKEQYDKQYIEKVKAAEAKLKSCLDDPLIPVADNKKLCPIDNVEYNYDDDYGGKYKTAFYTCITFICLTTFLVFITFYWIYKFFTG
jgi:preprotein translocase subunit SecG